MCHGNLKLKLPNGSPILKILINVYVYKNIIKIGSNENSPTFYKNKSRILLPWQKHGNYPVINIYG